MQTCCCTLLMPAIQMRNVRFITCYQVLQDIGVDCSNVLLVLNKADQAQDRSLIDVLRRHYDDTITISARTGQGLPQLSEIVSRRLAGGFVTAEIETGSGNGKLFAWLSQHAEELDRTYNGDGSSRVKIVCRMARCFANAIDEADTTVSLTEDAVLDF